MDNELIGKLEHLRDVLIDEGLEDGPDTLRDAIAALSRPSADRALCASCKGTRDGAMTPDGPEVCPDCKPSAAPVSEVPDDELVSGWIEKARGRYDGTLRQYRYVAMKYAEWIGQQRAAPVSVDADFEHLLNDFMLDEMVNRFLGWKLPDDFSPDNGISFNRNLASAPDCRPIGTNLLTATQAREMLEYVLSVPRPAQPMYGVCKCSLNNSDTICSHPQKQQDASIPNGWCGECEHDIDCHTPLYTHPAKPQPALTVWEGAMPESNGKSNFTAVLHRKDAEGFDISSDGFTIERSEYPDRVRYEADRVRYLIGELKERPDILAYDANKHSGYSPAQPDQVGAAKCVCGLNKPVCGYPFRMAPADICGCWNHTDGIPCGHAAACHGGSNQGSGRA